jgi:uncharacterized membrane protein YkvI
LNASIFKKYVLPGMVFQSVVIAGGYGTGREIVEFFLTLGPVSGLVAMLGVSMVIWSLVCAVTFELARLWRAYEYRAFFKRLLGRGWILFEICYITLMLIVLAVVGAAAGSILEETFGLPYAVGVLGIMAAVGALVFFGTDLIERFLAGWSFLLYGVYLVLVFWAVARFGPDIQANFAASSLEGDWIGGGVRYAGYNLAVIPAVLFALHHIETRKEAVGAGLLAGPIAIIPAFLFYVAMVAVYPGVVDQTVPANYVLEALGSGAFQLVFQLVLFGTLVETGTGFIHAVNERVFAVAEERGRDLPRAARPVIAVGFLLAAALLARVGLVGLIARGYGTLTFGILLVYVIPVLTWGVWLARQGGSEGAAAQG